MLQSFVLMILITSDFEIFSYTLEVVRWWMVDGCPLSGHPSATMSKVCAGGLTAIQARACCLTWHSEGKLKIDYVRSKKKPFPCQVSLH